MGRCHIVLGYIKPCCYIIHALPRFTHQHHTSPSHHLTSLHLAIPLPYVSIHHLTIASQNLTSQPSHCHTIAKHYSTSINYTIALRTNAIPYHCITTHNIIPHYYTSPYNSTEHSNTTQNFTFAKRYFSMIHVTTPHHYITILHLAMQPSHYHTITKYDDTTYNFAAT